jgi:arylsulfatase
MGLGAMPEVVNGYTWELYNIANDYSEANDLAAKNPDKLRELQQLFLVEATKYNVLPLDNSVSQRIIAPRPSGTAGKNVFTYTRPLAGIDPAFAPNLLNRSYTITAEVEIPQGGAEGMIATMGGRFGGYGFYVLKGKPVFLYNLLGVARFRWEAPQALAPGKHTIVFEFTYDGPGPGKGGTGVLGVDGVAVATKTVPHTIPFLMTLDETFDIGSDTRTSVSDDDYQTPFRFTGTINKVIYELGPEQLSEADHAVIGPALAKARD